MIDGLSIHTEVAERTEPPPISASEFSTSAAFKSASGYVELHARSAFSFLRGASLPEHLVAAAMQAELPALALLDRDGVYGAPRFFQSAQENKFAVCPRVGAEITMEDGSVVPLLVASQRGYQNLCQLITEAKLVERAPHILEPWLRHSLIAEFAESLPAMQCPAGQYHPEYPKASS